MGQLFPGKTIRITSPCLDCGESMVVELRDETLPGFSDQLDKLAGNLVASFQQSDATVGAGQAGLFARTRPELETPDAQDFYSPALKPGAIRAAIVSGSGFTARTSWLSTTTWKFPGSTA